MSQNNGDLSLAYSELEEVQRASWSDEYGEAVRWAVSSIENALAAVDRLMNDSDGQSAVDYEVVGGAFHDGGFTKVDVAAWLGELRELEDDIEYDEPGPMLSQLDLEDLASDLESFLTDVKSYVNEFSTA